MDVLYMSDCMIVWHSQGGHCLGFLSAQQPAS